VEVETAERLICATVGGTIARATTRLTTGYKVKKKKKLKKIRRFLKKNVME
jgi:hypothetical protein